MRAYLQMGAPLFHSFRKRTLFCKNTPHELLVFRRNRELERSPLPLRSPKRSSRVEIMEHIIKKLLCGIGRTESVQEGCRWKPAVRLQNARGQRNRPHHENAVLGAAKFHALPRSDHRSARRPEVTARVSG